MKQIRPIVPNAGGVIEPSDVLGREREIARYWDTLQQQSLALLAPRRIGKTCICRKMHAKPAPGFRVKMRDLEGRRRAHELVDALYEDVEDTEAKRIVKRPVAAYVERVYDEASFGGLGI